MKKTFSIALLVALSIFSFGCSKDLPEALVTFHVANTRGVLAGVSRTQITMPASGFSVIAQNEQFMYSGDLLDVKVGEVTLPTGVKERGFIFYCSDRGKNRLYQTSAANRGAFIVVKYADKPIALRKIDTVIDNGILFAVSELKRDEDIFKKTEKLVEQIKKANELKDSSF